MRPLPVALVLLAVILAGCAQTGGPVETASAPNVTVDEARPEPEFNDIPDADLGILAKPDLDATLAEAPNLVPGEWWRIEMLDKISGNVTQFVRVVARVEGDSDSCDESSPQAAACGLYVFGMPHEGWWKEAVIFHA